MSEHNVIPELEDLIGPTGELVELPGNARKGDLDALAASLQEFGQHIPIVVQRASKTILKGNNTFRAATSILGWTEIARVFVDDDDSKAIARALIDNRTSDLGGYDEKLRSAQVIEASEYSPELFEDVGWDRYEIAEMGAIMQRSEGVSDLTQGYVPPSIVSEIEARPSVRDGEIPSHVVAPEGVDTRAVIQQGSGAAGVQQKNVVAQYTLVFDNPEQHTNWFKFVRWLRTDPAYDGDSIAERVMCFIDTHANYEG